MTMNEVKRRNAEAGYNFFDPDTMRFFDSRIESDLFDGWYFITSEKTGFGSSIRAFTVRQVQPDFSIRTIGEFNQYRNIEDAERAISMLA